jgi:nicotinamidase-related amidase
VKHPHLLSKRRTGLLIVDAQEKFKPVIPDFDGIVYNVVKLVLAFQMFKMPVVVTEQYPKGLGRTDARIKKQFSKLMPIEKMELSCTACPAFWKQVKPLDLKTVVICGIETHVCICQTVLGLIQEGYTVHVVTDAVSSRNGLDNDIALQKMQAAGAILCTTEMALFELAEKAGTEQFKFIQKMVVAAKAKRASGSAMERPDAAPEQTQEKIAASEKSRPWPPATPSAAAEDGEPVSSPAEPGQVENSDAGSGVPDVGGGMPADQLGDGDALTDREIAGLAGSSDEDSEDDAPLAGADDDMKDVNDILGSLGGFDEDSENK